MNDKKRKESLTKFKNFLSDYSVCLILLLCGISVFILAAAIAPHTISVDDESKISSTAANEKDVETEKEAEFEPKSEEEAKTSADENINFKVIKDYDGRLAVFTADGELERITNISTSLLPEFDKEQISNGIKVNSETELISILEGLDS